MIVTPEGLNVFPEDVERVLNRLPGVREAAVVGGDENDRVHAVLVVEPGMRSTRSSARANAELADHQKIRRAVVWPEPDAAAHRRHRQAEAGRDRRVVDERRAGAADGRRGADLLSTLVAKYAGRADLASTTTLDELGLSSLERVELMVALEDAFETRIDEGAFAEARDLSALRTLVEGGQAGAAAARAGRISRRGTGPGRRAPSAAPACRPGSCRSPACSRGFGSTAASTWRLFDGPGDLRREPSEPHGHAGHPGRAPVRGSATVSPRRWPRNSSRRTSFRESTRGAPGSPTA